MSKPSPREAWMCIIGFLKSVERAEMLEELVSIINEHFGLSETS